jgi:surface carbohydrate biosynthesis protein
MIKNFLYFLYLIKLIFKVKFIWKNPEKKKIIVFDNYTTRYISNKIFNQEEMCEILCPGEGRKIEYLYISLKILTKSIIEILKGNLTNFYYLAILKIIQPKVIITFTEYSFAFFKIAKKLKNEFKFIIIQMSHSTLFEYSQKDLNKFYTPEFFCLSKFTIDHYSSLGIKVEKYTAIGSINLSLAEENLSLNKIVKKTSPYICVVAGAMPFISQSLNNHILSQLYDRQIKLWKFINKLSQIHKIYFKLASRQEEDYDNSDDIKKRKYEREEKVFKEITNGNPFFTKEKRFKYKLSNYELAFNSELVVGFHSTLLLESLAKEKKILCLTSLGHYKTFPLDPLMPEDNISSMYNPTYEEFEERLLNIYKMPLAKYLEIMFYKKKYMLSYEANYSAVKKLQDKINKIIQLN